MSNAYKHIIINTSANLIKSSLLLLSIRMGAELLAPAVFGVVMFGRRISATVANLTQLGMSQAIQRYIPLHESKPSQQGRLRGNVLTIAGLVVVCSGVFVPFCSDFLGWLIYPEQSDATSLFWATYLLIIGFTLSYIVYSFLLAEFRFYLANMFEILSSVGLFLLVIFFYSDSSSAEVLLWLASLTATLSCSCLLIYFYLNWSREDILSGVLSGPEIGKVVTYGIPRGISATLEMATLLVGPWILRSRPEEAGALIVALTLVRLFQAVVTPASRVLGLHAVRALGRNETNHADKQTLIILAVALGMATVGALLVYMMKDLFISLLVGDSELAASTANYLKALLLFMPAAAGYYCLRSVVELRWSFPFNLFFLLVTLSSSYVVGSYLKSIGYSDSLSAIVSVQIILGMFGVYTVIAGFAACGLTNRERAN